MNFSERKKKSYFHKFIKNKNTLNGSWTDKSIDSNKEKDKKHTCIDLIYTIIHNLSKFLQADRKILDTFYRDKT